VCSNPPVADGTPCNDTFSYTRDDVCVGGICSGVTVTTGQVVSSGKSSTTVVQVASAAGISVSCLVALLALMMQLLN
jgi:hypothetical protein